MTLKECKETTRLEDGDCFVIRVALHKTSSYYSAARVAISEATRREMVKYLYMRKRCLQQLTMAEDMLEQVFIRWKGIALTPNLIHRIFQQAFLSVKLNLPVVRKAHYESVSIGSYFFVINNAMGYIQ